MVHRTTLWDEDQPLGRLPCPSLCFLCVVVPETISGSCLSTHLPTYPPAAPHPPYEPSGQTAWVSSSMSAPRAGCCPGSSSPSLPLKPNGSSTSLLNLHVQPQWSPLHEQGATKMSGAVAGEVMGIHTRLFFWTFVVEAVAGSQFCGWGD